MAINLTVVRECALRPARRAQESGRISMVFDDGETG